jgi:hypothetical protein
MLIYIVYHNKPLYGNYPVGRQSIYYNYKQYKK